MVEHRYRVKDLVNYPERPAKDYVDRGGRRRRVSYKPATKGLLNIAESTFWKMIRRGDFHVSIIFFYRFPDIFQTFKGLPH